MSLLYRRSLTIELWPGQILLRRAGHRLTLRGKKLDVAGQEVIAVEAKGDVPWAGALNALAQVLPRFIWRDMHATVILSNHFVQYAIVPWCGELTDEDEMVFAKHRFKEIYGDAAEVWDVRVSEGAAGCPRVASATDARMLEELRGLLVQMGVRTESIQPHLMLAFNSCRGSLRGRNAWFALLEPGNLCVALLQDGAINWIRKMRIAATWQDELPKLLERESCLAEGAAGISTVFLWAPDVDGGIIPPSGRWNIQHLKPSSEDVGTLLSDGSPVARERRNAQA